MGCLFPQADGLAPYWANIRKGVDAISDVPESHWSVADYFDSDPKAPDRTYARRGGFLAPVEFPAMEFGIAPHSIEATDTTQLLGLLVARRALDDAGYGADRPLDRDRVSVILGVTGTLGRARWTPSMMTCSPSLRPSTIPAVSGVSWPRRMRRCRAIFWSSTTYT